jgi:hypothetical protein
VPLDGIVAGGPSSAAIRKSYLLSLGLGGGVTVPTGAYKDAVKSGFNGQGYLLVHLGPLPALRFNIGYQKFNYKNVLGVNGGNSSILSGTGGLSINLFNGPCVRTSPRASVRSTFGVSRIRRPA